MKSVLRIGLCTLGLTLSALSHGERLGRLFFTPEQRIQLDRAYSISNEGKPNSSVLVINGIVQKNDGARTVWINGVARDAGSSNRKTPESLPVTVPGQAKPVKVKVGQKVSINPATP